MLSYQRNAVLLHDGRVTLIREGHGIPPSHPLFSLYILLLCLINKRGNNGRVGRVIPEKLEKRETGRMARPR
jgi:hypothetical protein